MAWFIAKIEVSCPGCKMATCSAYASFRKNRCMICKSCGHRIEEQVLSVRRFKRGNTTLYRAQVIPEDAGVEE